MNRSCFVFSSILILFYVYEKVEGLTGLKSNCSVSIERADRCAKTLLFEGDRDRFIPRNDSDMNTHCSIMTENMKCLEKHSKCYRPFPRQIFNMVLVHVRQAYKDRCVKKQGREEFIHHMKCIKNAEDSEPAHLCLDKWTVQMKLVSDTFKIVDHFPGVCCSFHMMKKCLVNAVYNACRDTTGLETSKYTDKTITAAFADFLDLACGKQKNLEDCDKTFADGTKKLADAVAGGIQPQNGSALFHALKIVMRHD